MRGKTRTLDKLHPLLVVYCTMRGKVDGDTVIVKTDKDEVRVPISNVAWCEVAKGSADK